MASDKTLCQTLVPLQTDGILLFHKKSLNILNIESPLHSRCKEERKPLEARFICEPMLPSSYKICGMSATYQVASKKVSF
jgi:hypothetical protein